MSAMPLRILVVLPMYGGSLPIGRYCAAALRALGHSVRVFEAPALYPAFTGLRKLGLAPAQAGQLETAFLQLVSQAVWAMVREQEPHLVLALAQAPLGRGLLQRLRRAGVRTAMWFVEDYKVFEYWRAFAPLYDLFAVIQKEPFLSLLAQAGQANALYLPLAALPDFHRPLELRPEEQREYGADVAFLGAGYPNRRRAFRSLAGRNFKLWGSDWEDEPLLAPHLQRHGARIGEEECVRIYNATRVNLNLHSSVSDAAAVVPGDFVNPRTFELAAAGAFQLVDARGLMPELFAPGELATFTTLSEMLQGIEYYLAHPAERQAVALRGRERVLAEHTYARRMQTLLDAAARCLGPWPEAEAAAAGSVTNDEEALPPDLAAELQDMVRRLGLGPHAGFDDVVAALRARSGALDEAEAGLLFLDEWRKQYKR
jgi:spore maturation protein CgeB